MSTSYYHRTNICDCCSRYEERHIGDSSVGWEFQFQAYEEIRSWKDWKKELRVGRIFDEYGREMSYYDFVMMVNRMGPGKTICQGDKTKVLRNFLDYVENDPIHGQIAVDYKNPKLHWKDEEGFSFSIPQFS